MREGLDEEIVYNLTKTMYENHDEVVQLNPQYLTDWSLDRALISIGAPIHPGAIRYYREAGVWTDEINALLATQRRE